MAVDAQGRYPQMASIRDDPAVGEDRVAPVVDDAPKVGVDDLDGGPEPEAERRVGVVHHAVAISHVHHPRLPECPLGHPARLAA